MNEHITLRKSTMNDASIVAALLKEHALYEGHQLAVKNQLTTLESNTHPATIFVIEVDNSVQGYMSLLTQYSTWNTERYLYLDWLFLRTEYRGLGIGQKLMAMASNYKKELNLSEIQWQTPNDNIDAIRFYKNRIAEQK